MKQNKRTFLWTIWDTSKKDYAVDSNQEIKIFKDKEPAQRLAYIWNWQEKNRYKIKQIKLGLNS